MSNRNLFRAAAVPVVIACLGLTACGYETGPSGQRSQGYGIGYGTWGSDATPPPQAGSGLLVPDSQLSSIGQTGTGAIGPGQGIGVAVPTSQGPASATTGSAQAVSSGPAQRTHHPSTQ